MGEKTKVPFISDTVEIDGIFYVEQRVEVGDRRKQKAKRVFYERRFQPDPRAQHGKHIDEEV
ncbi:hypothetical protein ACPV5O_07370 [Vibrio maritimus]|uniref:hypothetical protein n=1 Tax=Vibrio TaxID=662 RepID=UPI001F17F026|nr:MULTISPECIES: hypothetical protein [Vibrio]USD61178.1 hypothetical protein J4N45_04175 [Vibrio sp. SCSIO 43140]